MDTKQPRQHRFLRPVSARDILVVMDQLLVETSTIVKVSDGCSGEHYFDDMVALPHSDRGSPNTATSDVLDCTRVLGAVLLLGLLAG